MAKRSLGIDTVILCSAGQKVDRGRAFAAAGGSSELIVAAAYGDTAQGPLGGRVVDLDQAIVALAQQRRQQV